MITKLFFSNTALKSIVVLAFFIFSTSVFSQNEFITTWNTTSNGESITIPTFMGETYDYTVDWGDGSSNDTNVTEDATHNYAASDDHIITITGTFPRIYFNNEGDKDKIISIDQWGTNAWTSMENAFMGASNLAGSASDAPDLSGVTSMRFMFLNATVFNQDISAWITVTITDMAAMFANAKAFNQDIGGWNTSAVTNMGSMFSGASAFNQDISGWNISLVTVASSMFSGATAFNNGGQALNWNLSITNALNMFFNATTFNQDISAWDMSAVTGMQSMFENATNFNNGGKDLNWTWTSTALLTMEDMFKNATAFNQDVSSFDTSKVTNMRSLFRDATVFNQDISSWDMTLVTDMSAMFNSISFNNGNLPANWTMRDVTNMFGMFSNNTGFNQNISSWDTSNVTNMGSMFNGATAYNNGAKPLILNTASVTEMASMFRSTTAFNQNISSFDFSKISGVQELTSMFENATAFNNGGQLLTMNSGNINTMTNMFKGATAFNQPLNISTTNLITSKGMFEDATAFNQDISAWNTVRLVTLDNMFRGATAFDQDIGGWKVSEVRSCSQMFSGVTLSDANYDALLIGWDAQGLSANVTFHGGGSQYCTMAAQTARANMIASDGWTIADGGLFIGTCGQLGIEDNELDTVLLYPNPVKDVVELILTNNINTIKLNLYNITGQLIFSKTPHVINNKISFDLSQINTGIYFLNITTNDGLTTTKKVIKE